MRNVIEIIANELANKNKVITLKPGSIFEALEQPGSNEQELAVVCNAISSKLKNELVIIKEKMIPLMHDINKAITKKLLDHKEITEISKYNIIEFSIPSLVNELKDNGTITSKRSSLYLPVANISIPVPSKETIKSSFKHPNSAVNAYAQEVLNKYTEEDLILFWEKYLINVSRSNSNIDILSFNSLSKIEDIVLLYLAVGNIRNEKPAGVRVEDSAYNKVMNQFYSEIINYMAMALETLRINRSLKKVIIDIKDQYTIIVDSVLLQDLIDENYSPELLLGMLVSGNINTTDMLYNNIKTNADKYLKAWNNKVKIDRIASKQNEGKKYRTVYDIMVDVIFDEIIPNDLKEIVCVTKEQAKLIMKEKLENEPLSEIISVDYMSREIVAHILFPNTNFHLFTDYMLEYSKLDNTLTPSEAASFASLDLVLDYLLQQVTTGDI